MLLLVPETYVQPSFYPMVKILTNGLLSTVESTVFWISRSSPLLMQYGRKLALDFYNQINMLYGTVTEFCTPTECPVMSAGSRWVRSSRLIPSLLLPLVIHFLILYPHISAVLFFCLLGSWTMLYGWICVRYEYHWHDGKEFKKATKVCAPGSSSFFLSLLKAWILRRVPPPPFPVFKFGPDAVSSLFLLPHRICGVSHDMGTRLPWWWKGLSVQDW